MKSQWECFLGNLGVWIGSFTKLSPEGKQLEDTPSRLTLEKLENNENARLTLQRHGLQDLVLEFSNFSKSVLFFENGAFCQGSMQFSPISEFGAEFSLIDHNRRLRIVQIFDRQNQLSSITLIREHKEGTEKNHRPTLTVESLLGTWEGEAVSIYPDLRNPDKFSSQMELTVDGNGRLNQTLSFGARKINSSASIQGSTLLFDQNPDNPVQVLLLSDGASCTSPLKPKIGQSIFLEIGWLIQPDLRQRMIRSFNEKGEWVSLTLVTETKVR
jgi:Domain of unknown function (DUF3598)